MSGDITKYFDLHCDTPYECFVKNEPFDSNSLAVCGEQGKVFEQWRQCFAVWIKDESPNPFELYRAVFSDFAAKIEQKPENLTPIFTLEGASLLEENIERLERLSLDGIKVITLTWNGENLLAGGVDSNKGLSDFGREVISGMNRLKIACDLSHLNQKSFFEVLEVAEHPLVTHTCCRSLVNSRRNLTDEQIKAVVQSGGVIGLCFYPVFVGEDVFDGIYRNIFHLCDMGFEDNISIGSDFDGAQMSPKLDKISKIPQLYAFLSQKGLQKRLLDKIFYNNAEKFFVSL